MDTVKQYFKVLTKNFGVTFLMGLAISYTGAAMGFFQYTRSLDRFVLTFSAFWGFFTVAVYLVSEDEDVNTPYLIRFVNARMGLKEKIKDIMVLGTAKPRI